jgi:hypothetical protein
MGAVRDFIDKQFGVPTETTERVVVLGAVVPIEVLPANPNRFAWIMFNLGGGLAYIGFDSRTAALRGMQIAAGGGNIVANARDDLEYPTKQLFGIGSAATTLYILETVAI